MIKITSKYYVSNKWIVSKHDTYWLITNLTFVHIGHKIVRVFNILDIFYLFFIILCFCVQLYRYTLFYNFHENKITTYLIRMLRHPYRLLSLKVNIKCIINNIISIKHFQWRNRALKKKWKYNYLDNRIIYNDANDFII